MITLNQLPEDFTPVQFMQLDRVGLDAVPYEIKWWQCQAKGCKHGTRVRDYGLTPWFWVHRNSKKSINQPEEYWRNLGIKFWLCGKHIKFLQRLEKSYGFTKARDKICDFIKPTVVDL